MKISASEISMRSEHSSLSVYSRKESLTAWRDDRRRQSVEEEMRIRGDRTLAQLEAKTAPPPRVLISPEARALQKAEGPTGNADELDPKLALLIAMLERITGKKVHLVDAEDVSAEGAGARAVAVSDPPRAGWGMVYERHESYEEIEVTTVSASGTIKTADGRDLAFQVDLQMSRHYYEERHVSIRAGDALRQDPLVLNFGGTAAELHDQKFSFDLDGDGDKEQIAGFASASGYLALDRNGNGKVDSGMELFGPATNSGFKELSVLDSDGNGWIDENDAVFKDLKVWMPDSKGLGKLVSLKETGVGALALAHINSQFELRGSGNSDLGAVRETGVFLFENGGVGSLQEIDLTV